MNFLKNKIFKVYILLTLFLFGSAIFMFYYINEPEPTGIKSIEAETLAKNLLISVNDSAWQKTGAIKWNFAGKHSLIWDKKRHFTQVEWDNFKVILDINKKNGIIYENGQRIEESKELIEEAWKIWVNDSFWLNPISKIYDNGTSRSVVYLEGNSKGLLVKYTSGGNTPGDAYLWEIGKNGLPVNWKMWVSIIPIGGVKISWEKWITLSTGAKIATFHKTPFFNIKLTEIKASNSLTELVGEDLFKELEN